MIAFKNIVLTTDLSANAEAAIPYAVTLARTYQGSVTLILVLEDNLYLPPEGSPKLAPVQWMVEEHQEMEKRVRAKAAEIEAREKVSVIPVVLHGLPHSEVVKYAKAHKADCIVIATHGRTGFAHLAFGSVVEKIVRLSDCPVMAIRPNETLAKQDTGA